MHASSAAWPRDVQMLVLQFVQMAMRNRVNHPERSRPWSLLTVPSEQDFAVFLVQSMECPLCQ